MSMSEKQAANLYQEAIKANVQGMSYVTEKAFNEIIGFYKNYLGHQAVVEPNNKAIVGVAAGIANFLPGGAIEIEVNKNDVSTPNNKVLVTRGMGSMTDVNYEFDESMDLNVAFFDFNDPVKLGFAFKELAKQQSIPIDDIESAQANDSMVTPNEFLITLGSDGYLSYTFDEDLDLNVEFFDFLYPGSDNKVGFSFKNLAEKMGIPKDFIEDIEDIESLRIVYHADNGELDEVKLLARYASPKVLCRALEGAVQSNHYDVVDYLINLNADIDHNTALEMASMYGHVGALNVLSTKYDLNDYQNPYGETLLSVALEEAFYDFHGHGDTDRTNNIGTLDFLIDTHNMNINHQNSMGQTLLHKLLLNMHRVPESVVEIIHILKYRPDLELKNCKGTSLLDILNQPGNERLMAVVDELNAENESHSPR